jgi:hypothetical protein
VTSSSGRFPSLFGSHEVVRVVARGGMGAVFEVKSRTSNARHAAKTILAANDPKARARFQREAELLARCDRIPGIVKVHSFGESADGSLFMILDFIDGPSLDHVLSEKEKLGPIEAARIARDVARALGAVHKLGIIHRDVKPGNILVDAQGNPWLTDFGLAAARDLSRLTRTGAFLGTVAYCSPEQADGTPCTATADVYSLGCVLFHALAGEPPIVADSTVAHMANLAMDEPLRDVREVEPRVPSALASILARALEKAPADRYADGNALADDLERFLAGDPIEGARARAPWKPIAALLAVAAALALVLVVAIRVRAARAEAALEEARARSDEARLVLARGDLDGALAALEAARAALASGGRAGVAPVASAREAVDTASGEVAAARAQRAFARGALQEALDLLADERALPPDGHVTRARTLLALGRRAEAKQELADPSLESLPRARRAEAFELLGDAASCVDDAAAERAYGEAIDLGRSSVETRARRAGAAAACGHDELAVSEFLALVPDPSKLPDDRLANLLYAQVAPALYRRGSSGGWDERLLDAAWKLAPPPTDLAPRLRDHFLETARARAADWAQGFVGRLKVEDSDLDDFEATLRRGKRLGAEHLDPYALGFAPALQLVRGWGKNAPNASTERAGRVFVADWPEAPIGYFLLACSRRRVQGAPAHEGLEWAYAAIDRIPEKRPDEHAEVRRFAAHIVVIACELAEGAQENGDLPRLLRCAERANYAESYSHLAYRYRRAGQPEKSWELLDRAEPIETSNATYLHYVDTEPERLWTLLALGKGEGVPARARKLAAIPEQLSSAVQILQAMQLWGDIVAVMEAGHTEDAGLLGAYGVALVKIGRIPDARKVMTTIESRKPDAADWIRNALKEAEAPKKEAGSPKK